MPEAVGAERYIEQFTLLTNPANFTIVIDEKFEGDKNKIYADENGVYVAVVSTPADLQKAINEAKEEGDYLIRLEDFFAAPALTRADFNGEIWVAQRPGVNLVIDGCGATFDGSIKIHGGSSFTNATLAIRNVNFETATPELSFIMPNDFGVEGGVTRRYSSNVTVDNCTFTATGDAVNTVVGVQAKSSKNLKVVNCTATGMHSLIQAQSCDEDVFVDNATITGGKNGVAFKAVRNAVISNSTIEGAAYGIRFDGNIDNYSLLVKDCKVAADQPLIVRKMTGANNTIKLEGNNVFTTDALYQIVITKDSDDKPYSIPTGTYTLTGAEGYNVYPVDPTKPMYASSAEMINKCIEAGATTIKLSAGIYVMPSVGQKTLTFIGTDNPEDVKIATKSNGSYEGCDYAFDGATVTLENISINTPSTLYIGYARCKATYKNCVINGTYTLYDKSTFENCTFNVSGDVYNVWTWGATEALFENCTFNSDGKAMLLYGETNTKLTMNNCTFNDNGGLTAKKAAIEIGAQGTFTRELIVNNAVVNGYEINDEGYNTNTTLWGNKNNMSQELLNVVVDGVDVY